jgi:hypothetical protein
MSDGKRISVTVMSLAILISTVFGADPKRGMLVRRDDDAVWEGPCGHHYVIGIVAGILTSICIVIIFLCYWSSRKRRVER